jgi:hypothetical protein
MDGLPLARVMHPEVRYAVEGCGAFRGVLTHMRLVALLFTATLLASPAWAQQTAPSSPQDEGPNLPVSLSKIREALEAPPVAALQLDETPTFRVQIRERQKIDELLATLNFKAGPVPAGGLYMAEQNRVMFPSVDNPLRQDLAAFNQGELLTIAIENIVGKYLGGPAVRAITKAERAHAEAAARDEVSAAIAQYCTSQPNAGAGITICDTPVR